MHWLSTQLRHHSSDTILIVVGRVHGPKCCSAWFKVFRMLRCKANVRTVRFEDHKFCGKQYRSSSCNSGCTATGTSLCQIATLVIMSSIKYTSFQNQIHRQVGSISAQHYINYGSEILQLASRPCIGAVMLHAKVHCHRFAQGVIKMVSPKSADQAEGANELRQAYLQCSSTCNNAAMLQYELICQCSSTWLNATG